MKKLIYRQVAFRALSEIHGGCYADVALLRHLDGCNLSIEEKAWVTDLVYGATRRMGTLDYVITQLTKKTPDRQPKLLRTLLHMGLYQLIYRSQINGALVVNEMVELAKQNKLAGLGGVINGVLRSYLRQKIDLSTDEDLSIKHSYPDWIIDLWINQLGYRETELLCEWMNIPPAIDLRVNSLRASKLQVKVALESAPIKVVDIPDLPNALRLVDHRGGIIDLPGFNEGYWSVQDSSAQLVAYLLDPQPKDIIIDACGAPGGKTTHIAELIQDTGIVWSCDRTLSRLNKVTENANRLGLSSIKTKLGDSRSMDEFRLIGDRVLLDAPCSGLGTLHRRADARWQNKHEAIESLTKLQYELLEAVATWVKPRGILVYATCTLNPPENELLVSKFLQDHPDWVIEYPSLDFRIGIEPEGWIKIWPHRHQMDGFFMVKLRKLF